MLFSKLLVGVAVLASTVSAQTPYKLGLHLVKGITANLTRANGVFYSTSAQAQFTVINPAPSFGVTITGPPKSFCLIQAISNHIHR